MVLSLKALKEFALVLLSGIFPDLRERRVLILRLVSLDAAVFMNEALKGMGQAKKSLRRIRSPEA